MSALASNRGSKRPCARWVSMAGGARLAVHACRPPRRRISLVMLGCGGAPETDGAICRIRHGRQACASADLVLRLGPAAAATNPIAGGFWILATIGWIVGSGLNSESVH